MRKIDLLKKIFIGWLCISLIVPGYPLDAEGSRTKEHQTNEILTETAPPTDSIDSVTIDNDISNESFQNELPPVMESVGGAVYHAESDVIPRLKALTLKKQQKYTTGNPSKRSVQQNAESTNDLTKLEVEELVQAGASIEDLYWINYLLQDPTEISYMELLKKKQTGLSWEAIERQLISGEREATSVEDSVYSPALVATDTLLVTALSSNSTVTENVYNETEKVTPLEVEEASLLLTTFDATVSSVMDGLVVQQLINQTAKLQYSDHNGNSEVVDPASGSLTWQEQLIHLPGRDGLDLNIGVMYQSPQSFAFMRSAKYIENYDNLKKYNYLVSRYDLGIGWSFQFPSVQKIDGYQYYHDGHGTVYPIGSGETDLEKYSQLIGYKGKSMKYVSTNTGVSFNNGEETSSGYLEYLDKKREFFGYDGRLLGIVDGYGNTLTFNYTDRVTYDGASHKVISSITDTAGRTVTFTYETTLNTTETFSGENIVVQVYSGSTAVQQKVTLTKGRTALSFNGRAEGYAPTLWAITNQGGERTAFNYTGTRSNFTFEFKNTAGGVFYSYNTYQLLTGIAYPHSSTAYAYDNVSRNLGYYGFAEEFRMNNRSDTTGSKTYNKIKYTYEKDYTAWPAYIEPGKLPDGYTYSTTTTVQSNTLTNGLASTLMFNAKHQLISTLTQAANGEKKVVNHTAFDATFTSSPTQTTTLEYAAGDSEASANHLYSETTYTDWGKVQTQTPLLSAEQFNNGTLKQRYTTSYSYEPNYQLLSSQSWYQNEGDSAPLTERYTYTSEGRLASATNAKNEQTTYTYNYLNSSSQITQATAETRVDNQLTAKTVTQYGSATSYAYPTEQQQWMNVGASNQQIVKTTMTYDMGTGLLTSQSDGNGQTTSYTYDALGRPKKITTPTTTNLNGSQYSEVEDLSYSYVTSSSLDSFNTGTVTLKVQSIKTVTQLSNGSTLKTYVYDYYNALGLLLMEEKWDGDRGVWARSQYHYDDQGRAVYAADAAGNTVTATYDSWGRQVTSTDAYGNLYVTEFDLKARNAASYMIVSGSVEKLNYVLQSYDQWGQVTSNLTYKDWPNLSQPIRETYSYDITGNVTAYTDPQKHLNDNGVTTVYGYDALNRLISVKDALNQTTAYIYDANGQISQTTIQAPGATPQLISSKTYNELGLMTEKKDASGSRETLQYDPLGLATSRTDRNGSVYSYQYNEAQQPTTVKVSGILNNTAQSQEIRYSRSTSNIRYHISQMYINGSLAATQSLLIDSQGRTRAYESVVGTHTAYISNSIDIIGQITRISDVNQSFYTNYQYNKMRVDKVQMNGSPILSSAASANVQYAYTAGGLVQSIIYPALTDGSILKTEYTYNKALNWVESITNTKGSTVLSKYTYGYDNNGNITSVVETLSSGATQTTTYGYDALNRLTSAVHPGGGTDSYTYDVRGNRLTLAQSSGSTAAFEDTSYTYDLQNTLTAVTKGSTTTAFTYYADGLRFKKVTNGAQTQYNYNFSGQVITEEKSSGQKANYVRGDRVLVKKDKTASKDYYYLYNGHGDVVQIVDTSGNIVNSYAYDEWGNITSQTEGISNPFKYTGEIYDEETGLYYLRARYYDPSIGRFLNEDTLEGQIDNPLSLNLYTYVVNNPLRYIDPTGHMHMEGAGWSGFAGDANNVDDPWGWTGFVGDLVNFFIISDINTLMNPDSSRLAKGFALAGIIPFGKVLNVSEKLFVQIMKAGKLVNVEVSSDIIWAVYKNKHNYKDIKGYKKMSWSDIRNYTKTGPAMYKPDINIEAIERYAWEYGIPTTNGKTWKVMQFDEIIGAIDGKDTKYMRIEMTQNTIHGHPITEAEYRKLLKEE